jgi:hypothetical protein
MSDPTNRVLPALHAQQSPEIKHVSETPGVYSAFAGSSGFLSSGTPRPLTKTQLLVRQPTYTRRQLLPSNFTEFLVARQWGIFEATTVPLLDLIAMLDRDHPEGARFVVVCKNTTRHCYVSTALDLQSRRFYRATSPTGLVSFWKGIAKRRPQVQMLAPSDPFEG